MPLKVFEDKRPLYQTVAEKLTAAIEVGRYPVGTMLPTEAELCAQFGVSRQTIREATRLLLQIGLVSRHQGVGTRVERTRVAEQYVTEFGKLAKTNKHVEQPNYVLDVIRHDRATNQWFLARKLYFSRIDLSTYRQTIYDRAGNVATDATYDDFEPIDGGAAGEQLLEGRESGAVTDQALEEGGRGHRAGTHLHARAGQSGHREFSLWRATGGADHLYQAHAG